MSACADATKPVLAATAMLNKDFLNFMMISSDTPDEVVLTNRVPLLALSPFLPTASN
jgi:hypothetical protein